MRYLALGDSYTIGELVDITENFPYQLTDSIRQKGFDIEAPEIIAKTGWTTSDLLAGIESRTLLKSYDFVTLLIGVNNQYQNKQFELFEKDFDLLVDFSLSKIKNRQPNSLFLMSIPNYGLTPFAKNKNPKEITLDLTRYNQHIEQKAKEIGAIFINITPSTETNAQDENYLAIDLLHPNNLEYLIWKNLILEKLNLTSYF